MEESLISNNKNNNNELIKLIYKKKSQIMEKIEEKFDQDDYLQLKKLEISFNSFLINIYYNYLKKIK